MGRRHHVLLRDPLSLLALSTCSRRIVDHCQRSVAVRLHEVETEIRCLATGRLVTSRLGDSFEAAAFHISESRIVDANPKIMDDPCSPRIVGCGREQRDRHSRQDTDDHDNKDHFDHRKCFAYQNTLLYLIKIFLNISSIISEHMLTL